MATILTYTAYDDVRAVLGVSDEELEDTTLGLSVYSDSLSLDLLEVGATLPAVFTSTQAIPSGSRTAAEQKLLMLTSQFATYQVARQAGIALPMAPKTISDGKANMSRFADGPYRAVIERIEQEYGRLKQQLEVALAAVAGTQTTTLNIPTFLVGAGPSIDRVTNT